MNDGRSIALGVISNVNDDAYWLIFADWLDENDDIEPLLGIAIRNFIAGRKYKSCSLFMYSCGEILTNGNRRHDLDVLVMQGCDNCSHWANSQIVQDRLLEIVERIANGVYK